MSDKNYHCRSSSADASRTHLLRQKVDVLLVASSRRIEQLDQCEGLSGCGNRCDKWRYTGTAQVHQTTLQPFTYLRSPNSKQISWSISRSYIYYNVVDVIVNIWVVTRRDALLTLYKTKTQLSRRMNGKPTRGRKRLCMMQWLTRAQLSQRKPTVALLPDAQTPLSQNTHSHIRNSQNSLKNTFAEFAEEYLTQVLKKGTKFKKMDQLGIELYHHSKSVSLQQLPPTSSATRLHILRAVYATNKMVSLLSTTHDRLDPTQHGFEEVDDLLTPKMDANPIPEEFATHCNCLKRGTQRCPCLSNAEPCCSFCRCQSGLVTECKDVFGKT